MKRIQFLVLVILVIILAGTGALVWRSTTAFGIKARDLRGMLPPEVDMRLTNLLLNEAGSKDRKFSLAAEKAQYFKARDTFILEKVQAKVESGGNLYHITANTGTYEHKAGQVVLNGQVEVRDGHQRLLEASSLNFSRESGMITSGEPFRLTGPKLNLSGSGFDLNTQTHYLLVSGRAKLTIN